jgi:hypothetical protein
VYLSLPPLIPSGQEVGQVSHEAETERIPIDALFDEGTGPNLSADPRGELRDAEVIRGVDWTTQNEFLVFGRDTMERIVRSGAPEPCRVLQIGLDQDTDELEKLLALVQVVKGRHDYQPS